MLLGVDVRLAGERELPQFVVALHSPGCLTGCLHGGQQKLDQETDDPDHHERLDERHATPRLSSCHGGASRMCSLRD
jgi:hypothetical protein